MLAKAVAKTLRAQGVNVPYIGGAFISLSSADIVRAEVGTSEKMVLSSFQTARANAPSVIFIDEFQALFTERSRGGSSRLSSTLLDCMDDLQTRRGNAPTNHDDSDEAIKKGRVLVLAATNTPWMVDSAFLRPGRFDRVVHVGLPKTDERKSILLVHIERMRTEFSHDFGKLQSFCRKIATRTEGFSGADISALCRAAAVRCLDEQASCIEEKHFEEVLDNEIQPSCSKSLVEKVMRWRP